MSSESSSIDLSRDAQTIFEQVKDKKGPERVQSIRSTLASFPWYQNGADSDAERISRTLEQSKHLSETPQIDKVRGFLERFHQYPASPTSQGFNIRPNPSAMPVLTKAGQEKFRDWRKETKSSSSNQASSTGPSSTTPNNSYYSLKTALEEIANKFSPYDIAREIATNFSLRSLADNIIGMINTQGYDSKIMSGLPNNLVNSYD